MTSIAPTAFTLACKPHATDETFTVSRVPDATEPVYIIKATTISNRARDPFHSVQIEGSESEYDAVTRYIRAVDDQGSGDGAACPTDHLGHCNYQGMQTVEGHSDAGVEVEERPESGLTVTGSLLSENHKKVLIKFFKSHAFAIATDSLLSEEDNKVVAEILESDELPEASLLSDKVKGILAELFQSEGFADSGEDSDVQE